MSRKRSLMTANSNQVCFAEIASVDFSEERFGKIKILKSTN